MIRCDIFGTSRGRLAPCRQCGYESGAPRGSSVSPTRKVRRVRRRRVIRAYAIMPTPCQKRIIASRAVQASTRAGYRSLLVPLPFSILTFAPRSVILSSNLTRGGISHYTNVVSSCNCSQDGAGNALDLNAARGLRVFATARFSSQVRSTSSTLSSGGLFLPQPRHCIGHC